MSASRCRSRASAIGNCREPAGATGAGRSCAAACRSARPCSSGARTSGAARASRVALFHLGVHGAGFVQAQERNHVLGYEQRVRRTMIASDRREGVELGEAASALPGLALRLVSPECQSRIGRGRIRWETQDIGPFLDGLGEVCVPDGRPCRRGTAARAGDAPYIRGLNCEPNPPIPARCA